MVIPRRAGFQPASDQVDAAGKMPALLKLVGHDEETELPTDEFLKRLPPAVAAELRELPPVCVSSLPGIVRLPPVQKEEIADWESPTAKSQASTNPPSAIPDLPSSLLNPHPRASADWKLVKQEIAAEYAGLDPHAEAFAKDCYPSATACRKCHEQIYEEWAISSHANASVSPMFHKFEQKMNSLAQGTLGYFCMRCHAPVATTMQHPRWASIGEGPKVFREGVTCVACHRVVEKYAKTNGERRMESGPLEVAGRGQRQRRRDWQVLLAEG